MTDIVVQPSPPTIVTTSPSVAQITVEPQSDRLIESGIRGWFTPEKWLEEITGDRREVLSIGSPTQATFTLSQAPSLPHRSSLFLNGVRATYGVHFQIDGAILTWIASYALEPTDLLEILYS